MSSKSLWVDLSEVQRVRAPKTVLLEQAEYLTQATKGVLVGALDSVPSRPASSFAYDLQIRVPALNNYSVTVLQVQHGLELYPVRLIARGPAMDVKCGDEQAFEDAVASVLSSPDVEVILSRLLSMVQ